MSVWYRIFGQELNPFLLDRIIEKFKRWENRLKIEFTTDSNQSSDDWRVLTIHHGRGTPLIVERYLATEEGIRGELNTWAGFLETCDGNPNHVPLMEQMIQTQELFTLCKPIDVSDEELVGDLCESLCRVISDATLGFYQIDAVGFHDPEGNVLLQESW